MSSTAPLSSLSSTAASSRKAAITIVMPTLDEARQICDAVSSLQWADEVIVVDGGSKDGTPGIAETAGARVLVAEGVTIAGQRNAGIAAARNHWILALDADERVTPALRDELTTLASDPVSKHQAYRIKFQNTYLGRELRHGPWGRDWHVRVFTRERRWITDRVHERLEAVADVGSLHGTIVHTPYRDITHHVMKIVKYAKWGAEDLHARGRSAGLWTMAARPAWRFVRDYVFYGGWRDGIPGFIAAALSAFAAFLKYALLFMNTRTER